MESNSTKALGTTNKIVSTNKKKAKNKFGAYTNVFKGLYKRTLNMLFPAHIKCIVCGDDLPEVRQIEVCDKCSAKLNFISKNSCCKHCGSPVYGDAEVCLNCKDNKREFDQGRSVFVYDGEIEKLIAGLKFNNKPYLSRTLGRYLASLYQTLDWHIDMVIPVPMTEARKKWRGYNQAELLATEFCEAVHLPLNTQALQKVRETDEQKELSMQERQKNILDAFKVQDKYYIKGKSILIIDDVMTTGATANACATALKKAHASKVYVLTIAHGKPKLPMQNNMEDVHYVINSVK